MSGRLGDEGDDGDCLGSRLQGTPPLAPRAAAGGIEPLKLANAQFGKT